MSVTELLPGSLFMTDYKNGVIVYGNNTKDYKDTFKSLGGKYNPRIKLDNITGCCWVFSKAKENDIKRSFSIPTENNQSMSQDETTLTDIQEIHVGPDLKLITHLGKQLVYGNTFRYRDLFRRLGGSWSPMKKLSGKQGCCWIIDNPNTDEVVQQLRNSILAFISQEIVARLVQKPTEVLDFLFKKNEDPPGPIAARRAEIKRDFDATVWPKYTSDEYKSLRLEWLKEAGKIIINQK